MASIPEIYSGKKLFITGATGFIGKIMSEKLLRDCKEIAENFILVRTKKGVDAEARKEELLSCIVSFI